jgi:hypothetical protein
MTSTYNTTNYVLDEIDLMNSFNFLLQVLQHLTQIWKKEQHQRNYIPMIVKILTVTRIKGAKKTKGVGRGEEERTNSYKNYNSSPQEF